jgi:hypothetical protein
MSAAMPLAIKLLREDALGDIHDAWAVPFACYKQSLQVVEALDPERFGGPGQTPLSAMDEQVHALTNEAFEAGVHVGAAFARAELALQVERRICRRCNGGGVDRRRPDDPCTVCGGEGTVPAGDVD